ncbi:caspase family protein [Actinoplanes solisilvae]|uniref:caspase family protein n=1 Tax=Actinoplanes solisilvae TaxID=2486853 RepID=UPI000FDC96A9|nr:caspase family protein [Actinoplanes solisilvae]
MHDLSDGQAAGMSSRALLIAVDSRIFAPRADIGALGRALGDPAVGDFEVRKLVNPTGTEMQRTVGEFFGSAGPDDVLLLHFAGLGFLDGEPAARELTGSIAELAESSVSRRVVLLVDRLFPDGLPAQFPAPGRFVLAATGEALEERSHSMFTSVLADGLRTGAADLDGDGWISVTDLHAYALDRMAGLGAPQTPILLGDRAHDLILARGPANVRAMPPDRQPPAIPVPAATTRHPMRPALLMFATLCAAVGIPAVVEADAVLWGVSIAFGAAALVAFVRRRVLWGFVLLAAALLAGPTNLGVLG